MTSSNDGNDNDSGGPEQLPQVRRDKTNPVHDIQASIAGEESVDVWRQACAVFQGNPSRQILVFGLTHSDGLEPFMEEFAFAIAKKVVAIQDNKLPLPPEPKSFAEASDNKQINRIKSRNLVTGLLFASFVRRWKKSGLEEVIALTNLAQLYSRPKSEIKLLIKYAASLRWKRIEQMRATLVPKWEAQGWTAREIGRRLNVTRQYAKRLMNELKWEMEEAK
ncbi:MAG: hypothetical protein RIC29_15860 [Rhodospirillaceae bacterium]